MTRRLDPATEVALRRVWAGLLGVEAEVLDGDGIMRVGRPGMTAVVVLRLGAATVVAAPERALSALDGLAPQQLLDTAVLLESLVALSPRLVGIASLGAVDRGTLTAAEGDRGRRATRAETEAILAACSEAEREESGIEGMSAWWAAGEAVAGYEVWDDAVAHLGVAVAPEHRGRGLGAVAARAAAVQALEAGLVPQWRCGRDNPASARVAERLGFVTVGEQLAIDIASGRIDG